MGFWLEHDQAQRFLTSTSKNENDKSAVQLGEFQVPIIHHAANNNRKNEGSVTAEDMTRICLMELIWPWYKVLLSCSGAVLVFWERL